MMKYTFLFFALLSTSMSFSQAQCGYAEAVPVNQFRDQSLLTRRVKLVMPVVFDVICNVADDSISDGKIQAGLAMVQMNYVRRNPDLTKTHEVFSLHTEMLIRLYNHVGNGSVYVSEDIPNIRICRLGVYQKST